MGVEPLKADETKMPSKPERALVPSNGFHKKGLITNHLKVSIMKTEDFYFAHL